MRAYVSLAPSRTSPHPTSPSLVSTRIRGHVKGAPVTTATRRSVILRPDGSDARLTPAWTKLAAASAAALPFNVRAPAALRPTVLKNERRATGSIPSSLRPRPQARNSVEQLDSNVVVIDSAPGIVALESNRAGTGDSSSRSLAPS